MRGITRWRGFAASAAVPFSSIRQPTDAIGRTAVELLAEELDVWHRRHRAVVYTPELVIRQSTAGTASPAKHHTRTTARVLSG
ncbi:substrate-binding domain-containing protein [Arthrobacter sp. GN70]|uniref:Transcriptional regulator LacI/GalR-like sensor domain-containing protein n=1 Tax=Arthrobacter terricola TaxID=2547396 RepID=A0A4R5KEW5_9MICC|nr:substrate-binding domain-containing protein [Arthrobacter sp. GN70]TDF92680.1 hypothetical protein E1809_17685 [Arthrobacter terricola]